MRIMVTLIYITVIELLYLSEINCNKRYLDPSIKYTEQKYFSNILDKMARLEEKSLFDERRSRRADMSQMKLLYDALSDQISAAQFKKWLRQEDIDGPDEASVKENLEKLVENELINALSKKSSAILDKPYVQKKGRNDFLVIKTELRDPFVTIVPNDIYYNSEKKCINWMDDCNQKGLRERLLQKVNSPYK
ncbi:uncharacterized protein LOC124543358 [Vanessa cardui]|uniref:uncharacterized protein LOC124543358 n=1 Tax=Vanessa cardui TaxID=171605 RepID=UPI001F1381BB|nr:uncharacterized protein LOC124543358 [Vanessa cardui]